MEEQKDMLDLLDMMIQPVFCVKDNVIIRTNAAAQQMFLRVGDDVRPLLEKGAEEYEEFRSGCLYLTLSLFGQSIGASIRRIQDMDVFEVDTDRNATALQAMALAACELRKPLTNVMISAAELLKNQEDPETRHQLAQLNKGLYQILRLVGNMSDAEDFSSSSHMATVDLSKHLRDFLKKTAETVSRSGVSLHFEAPSSPAICLADCAQLERALLNIISNALKFKCSRITVSLSRSGHTLRLMVEDDGSGIAETVMGSLFQRHLRKPGIGDGRQGLGLGIRMVHAAAAKHGGTLLVTRGEQGGTRIVMTLAIRQSNENRLGNKLENIDFSGGFDQCLVELSDCLPAELYDGKI